MHTHTHTHTHTTMHIHIHVHISRCATTTDGVGIRALCTRWFQWQSTKHGIRAIHWMITGVLTRMDVCMVRWSLIISLMMKKSVSTYRTTTTYRDRPTISPLRNDVICTINTLHSHLRMVVWGSWTVHCLSQRTHMHYSYLPYLAMRNALITHTCKHQRKRRRKKRKKERKKSWWWRSYVDDKPAHVGTWAWD